jgi:transposase-like protein
VLVELGLVEQRYAAVLEVLNEGATVTEVARGCGVSRQTVQRWLRQYADRGLAGLVDRVSRPGSCPHQMPAEVEALIVELRVEKPSRGPRTLLFELEARGVRTEPKQPEDFKPSLMPSTGVS